MSSVVFMFLELSKLVGQSFSAFSTSSLEYVSSVGSSHSLSETVLFLSLTLFRLIGSKHFVHLLVFVFIPDYEISGIYPEACCFTAELRFIQ